MVYTDEYADKIKTNGLGSTPGGILELDTGYHPFVV